MVLIVLLMNMIIYARIDTNVFGGKTEQLLIIMKPPLSLRIRISPIAGAGKLWPDACLFK